MNPLYNALVSGQREYKEDGTEVVHPPTSLHLQAARYIKQMDEINIGNNNIMMQLQQHNSQLLLDNQNLQEKIHGLQNYIAEFEQAVRDIKLQTSVVETSNSMDSVPNSSLLEGKGETSPMGCFVEEPSRSDSDSEGRGTN